MNENDIKEELIEINQLIPKNYRVRFKFVSTDKYGYCYQYKINILGYKFYGICSKVFNKVDEDYGIIKAITEDFKNKEFRRISKSLDKRL